MQTVYGTTNMKYKTKKSKQYSNKKNTRLTVGIRTQLISSTAEPLCIVEIPLVETIYHI